MGTKVNYDIHSGLWVTGYSVANVLNNKNNNVVLLCANRSTFSCIQSFRRTLEIYCIIAVASNPIGYEHYHWLHFSCSSLQKIELKKNRSQTQLNCWYRHENFAVLQM
jgi:hypothetical protein